MNLKDEPSWTGNGLPNTMDIHHAIRFYKQLDEKTMIKLAKEVLEITDGKTAQRFSTLAIVRRLASRGFGFPSKEANSVQRLEHDFLNFIGTAHEEVTIEIDERTGKEKKPIATPKAEQILKNEESPVVKPALPLNIEEYEPSSTPQTIPPKRRGRPPGSKNRPKAAAGILVKQIKPVAAKLTKSGKPRKQRSDKGKKRK